MPASYISAALTLCAIALPISIAGSNVALALLAVALLTTLKTSGRDILSAWRREPLLAALAVYAAVGAVCAAFSAAPAESLRDALKDLHRLWAAALFVAAIAVAPKTHLEEPLGLSLGGMSLIGIGQTVFGGMPNDLLVRAHGFVHPVVFGEQMALAALGGACVLLKPKPGVGRTSASIFTGLVILALVASQTRMALIAACAGFAVITLLEPRARRWAMPLLMATALIGLAWEAAPTGSRNLHSLFKSYDPENPQQARWALWHVALRMFRDHPALGIGPGGYQRAFPIYHPIPVDGDNRWGSAHNLYFHQAAERGLLGVAALLALGFVLFRGALRSVRTAGDSRALWAMGSAAALAAMSLTETAFQNEQFATLFLLIWAWGTAALRESREVL